MSEKALDKLIDNIQDVMIPMDKMSNFYPLLFKEIGNAHLVLIGEASHGTEEFYQVRMAITEQLIKEHGFMAVAIEGDWPDVYQIHRYLQGETDESLSQVLSVFKRFPTWMWRNTAMIPFLQKLHKYNQSLPELKKIGFYGLDLYSLHASMNAVIAYLKTFDSSAAERAIERYSCFDLVNGEPEYYANQLQSNLQKSCLKQVVEQFLEMQTHAFMREAQTFNEPYFFATQNARLVKNAESYYRNMFQGHVNTWNIRDRHMAETMNVICDYLELKTNKPAKVVVWAHNSHIGDARATEMSEQGEINLGQLLREEHDKNVYSIGFSTYDGFVTASTHWGETPQEKSILPGLPGSYESIFHQVKLKNFMLPLQKNRQLEKQLNLSRLQRAIGVIYRPETERLSHYFFSRLPLQFDSIIHLDTTHALKPLSH